MKSGRQVRGIEVRANTSDPYPPTSQREAEFGLLFGLFEAVNSQHGVVYVSTPITSGKAFVQAASDGVVGDELKKLTADIVGIHKIAAARLSAHLRTTLKSVVVNPAQMPDIPDWTQTDYRAYWAEFIKRFCDKIYFVNGWEYSRGCAYEMLRAIECGRKVYDHNQAQISPTRALERLNEAITDYDAAGLDSAFLKNVFRELSRYTHLSAPLLNERTITSKTEMYALYHSGKFGNKLLTWNSLDDYKRSGFARPVVLRYKGKAGGGWVAYEVSHDEVDTIVASWLREGAQRDLIAVNESAPDHELLLQGEVMRSTDHLSLRYSIAKLPMRKALAECQKHARGIEANMILRSAMDAASWDDLNSLLDEYDGAVVEFSTWARDVGVIPRRNTVFWEVRHY